VAGAAASGGAEGGAGFLEASGGGLRALEAYAAENGPKPRGGSW
jgi:hypothetical protein